MQPSSGPSLSDLLFQIAVDTTRPRISIGDLLRALDDRAIAALLLLFALPNAIPMPPGTSAVLGAPLLFLTAQLALSRGPWLPQFIANRSVSRGDFASVVARAAPWLARAEKLLKPRLRWLTCAAGERLIGVVCLLLAIVLVLPIPFGNMLPAAAICLFALGILERDGLWIIAGVITTIAATVLVSGVLLGALKAGLFLFERAFG